MGEYAERIKAGFEAFNRREFDAVLELCHPEVEWTPPAELPGSRTYHGRAGVREALDDLVEIFPDLRAEPVDLIEEADRVVGFYIWRGGGTGTIPAFEVRASFLAHLEDGSIRTARFWTQWESALDAAGLPQEKGPGTNAGP